MRINERVFERLNGEAFEVQELAIKKPKEGETSKRKVELFYLDEYPDVLDEFSRQGKFAVWSSVDGVNYRLAIEKGYYQTLKQLYGVDVNTIWTDFWDECSVISSNFTKKVVFPGTVLVILSLIIFYATLRNANPTLNNVLSIAVGAIYLFVVLVFRKLTTKKIGEANQRAIDEIKKFLGANRFEELLDEQRKYIDDYTQRLIEEADRMDSEFEASQQGIQEEDDNSNEKEHTNEATMLTDEQLKEEHDEESHEIVLDAEVVDDKKEI